MQAEASLVDRQPCFDWEMWVVDVRVGSDARFLVLEDLRGVLEGLCWGDCLCHQEEVGGVRLLVR